MTQPNTPRPWKPAELARLKQTIAAHASVRALALELGRGVESCYRKAGGLGIRPPRRKKREKPLAAGAVLRKCLGCGEPFPSEWKGNRMCLGCRKAA